MDNHNKELAARLVKEKLSGAKITYSEISARTGYERRQLACKRLNKCKGIIGGDTIDKQHLIVR